MPRPDVDRTAREPSAAGVSLQALAQALSDERGLTHTFFLGLELHALDDGFGQVVLGLHRAFAQLPQHFAHNTVQLRLVARINADPHLEAIPSLGCPVEIPNTVMPPSLP